MPIGVMPFRALSTQESSPFGGVLADAIAKRLATAKAEAAENEAPWAGLAKQAHIRSQNAYSSAVIPQFQAGLLKNDKILANIKDPQQRAAALLALGQNSPNDNDLNTSINRQLMEIANRQNTNNSPLGKLGQSIAGLFGGSDQQPQGPQQEQPPQPQNAPNPVAPPVNGQSGWDVTPPTSAASQGRSSENVQFGQNAADLAGQVNQGATEGTGFGKQSADQLKAAQETSQNALRMDQLIDSAIGNYKKSFLKGPGLGKLAKLGPDADQALKDTNNMAVAMASQLFGSNATNAKEAIATGLKLNMEDPERAFNEVGTKLKAENDRLKWQGTFFETAKALNVLNPADRDQLWFDYNAKYPPYDYKKHKPIFENLGLDQNQMAKFITQENAKNNTLNKKIATTLNKNENETQTKNKYHHLSKEELEAIANG